MASIVDSLRRINPNVQVFLVGLPDNWKPVMNEQINLKAQAISTTQSNVTYIPQPAGWIANPSNANTDTLDWVHPNAKGDDKLAQAIFNGMEDFLGIGATPTATPTAVPATPTVAPTVPAKEHVSKPTVNNVYTNSLKVNGTCKTEGASITVSYGKVTKKAVVKNGKFSVAITKQKPGTTLSVKGTHSDMESSQVVKVTVKLQKATIKISSKSTKVSGTAYSGSSIKITVGGKTYYTKANSKGAYSMKLKAKPKANSSVVVKSSFGKYSSTVTFKI